MTVSLSRMSSSGGQVPVKELELISSSIKSVRSPSSVGTLPESKFDESERDDRVVSWPICVGMFPEIEFLERSSSRTDSRPSIASEGRVPLILLDAIEKKARLVKVKISTGNSPVKSLDSNDRYIRLVSPLNDVGSGPVKKLASRRRRSKRSNLPISGPMVPSRLLLPADMDTNELK